MFLFLIYNTSIFLVVKEPYPARSTYQVAKLPLVIGIHF